MPPFFLSALQPQQAPPHFAYLLRNPPVCQPTDVDRTGHARGMRRARMGSPYQWKSVEQAPARQATALPDRRRATVGNHHWGLRRLPDSGGPSTSDASLLLSDSAHAINLKT